MENVHQLTLVLMKSLNLYIKNRVWINVNAVVLLNVLSQTYFILIFNIQEFLLAFLIIYKCCQFFNMRQVCDPLITDFVSYPVS